MLPITFFPLLLLSAPSQKRSRPTSPSPAKAAEQAPKVWPVILKVNGKLTRSIEGGLLRREHFEYAFQGNLLERKTGTTLEYWFQPSTAATPPTATFETFSPTDPGNSRILHATAFSTPMSTFHFAARERGQQVYVSGFANLLGPASDTPQCSVFQEILPALFRPGAPAGIPAHWIGPHFWVLVGTTASATVRATFELNTVARGSLIQGTVELQLTSRGQP